MDIEIPYDQSAHRRRRYRLLVVGVVLIVLIAVVSSRLRHKHAYSDSTSTSRLFVMEIGNLDGNSSKTGTIYIQTMPEWAPIGTDRFHNLVESDFFNDCRFFRVVPDFVVQFGINGDPLVEEEWRQRELTDDPVKHTNARGTITFATAGPDTRTTQLFINIVDNQRLDDMGFAPVAWVVRGMDVVDRIFDKWGEEPDQGEIITQGNVYLNENFPGLSYIISAEQTLE